MNGTLNNFQQFVLALAAALLLAGCGSDHEPSAPPAKDANVLVILIDALRSDHLDCYGYDLKTAPFVTQLTREGIVFEQVSATCSWTKPSIASLFTSLYPSQHGVLMGNARDTADHYVSDVLPPSLPVLAEFYRKAGYATFGAVCNSHLKAFMGFGKGFEKYGEITGEARLIADAFIEWMKTREKDRRPFFAYLHFLDVHSYTPPKAYRERFGKPKLKHFLKGGDFLKFRKDVKEGRAEVPEDEIEGIQLLYDAEIRYTDDMLRKIVDYLKERSAWDRTLFVMTSDHGEEFFEHNEFAHGHSMADNLLRIPFIMRLPGGVFAGKRLDVPANLVDIQPTLLDLSGISYPGDIFVGRSLVQPITDDQASERDRFRYGELFKESKDDGFYLIQSLRDRHFHFLRTYRPREGVLQTLRELKKKSLFDARLRKDRPELYKVVDKLFDLQEDPGEFNDVLADHPELYTRMSDYLKRIDQLLYRQGTADAGQVALDPETIEELKGMGYIR
jgi:arylsulfatase A-like enzyme